MAINAKPSKYRAKPCVVDGIRFASQKEARRYGELRLLEKAGEIRGLELQPEFELRVTEGHQRGGEVPIGRYLGDFRYELRVVRGVGSVSWEDIVEDAKGFRTALYRWKKKHVEAQYGITIREI